MIKVIREVKNLILINIFVVFVLFSQSVFATQIVLNIYGKDIKDGLFTTNNNLYSSSAWDFAPNLLPVDKWIPALEQDELNFVFRSADDSFSFRTRLEGIEYTVDNNKFSNANYTEGNCANNSLTKDGILLSNNGSCTSKKIFETKTSDQVKPFALVRPFISLGGLMGAIDKRTPGIYKGDVSYKVKYFFYVNGVKTYREFNQTLSIIINYQPVQLISVTKIGDGVISNLVYDKDKLTVSGETVYKVLVNGYLPYGLKMTFEPNDKSDRYLLKSETTNFFIPYYINCMDCNRKNIVDENGYKISSDPEEYIYFDDIYNDFHSYDFNIGFRNISSKSVRSGNYNGQFNVYFEAVL